MHQLTIYTRRLMVIHGSVRDHNALKRELTSFILNTEYITTPKKAHLHVWIPVLKRKH